MLPSVSSKENKKKYIKIFGGLDRRDKISDSSLSDMLNMSSDAVPAMTPRKPRRHICDVSAPTAICAPEYTGGTLDSFTGVSENRFIYKGKVISGILSSGEKSIADFNGKICIFPDKVYYDYLPDPTTGIVSESLTSMEKSLSISNATFHSSNNTITGEYQSYITASNANFNGLFTVGDSIIISGCSNAKNNVIFAQSRKTIIKDDDIVSAVVVEVTSTRLDLVLYNKNGQKATFVNLTDAKGVTLKIAIPDMDHICVHNNRLWGTATSGEYIYASKLGDCTCFTSFQGLSEDSWYSYIATGGGFTGICSYRTAVVAFKQNYIHHIYGDSPKNFSIPKQSYGGCVDGRSICEIGGVLYYLASNGFYTYSGGEPCSISPQLKSIYSSCIAGSDGQHYYAAVRGGDKTELLVYTPEINIWMKEDNTPFIGFCTYNGKIYGIAENKLLMLNSEDNESFVWSTVSKRFNYDEIDQKGLSRLYIQADLENETCITVSLSRDGGDFIECGKINGQAGFHTHHIPVRFGNCDSFRIMLEGEGRAVIHSIEITSHNGGRVYG